MHGYRNINGKVWKGEARGVKNVCRKFSDTLVIVAIFWFDNCQSPALWWFCQELERRLAQAAPQAPILIEASDDLLLLCVLFEVKRIIWHLFIFNYKIHIYILICCFAVIFHYYIFLLCCFSFLNSLYTGFQFNIDILHSAYLQGLDEVNEVRDELHELREAMEDLKGETQLQTCRKG